MLAGRSILYGSGCGKGDENSSAMGFAWLRKTLPPEVSSVKPQQGGLPYGIYGQ
jgi:hypothetical protein